MIFKSASIIVLPIQQDRYDYPSIRVLRALCIVAKKMQNLRNFWKIWSFFWFCRQSSKIY